MSVTTPILFSIGVIGGDKAKANLAMVGAAAVAVTVAMTKLWQAADEYGDALDRLTIDMSKYNATTKGLIGTTEGLQAANKLQLAGAKVSAEQMEAMGKAAITLSRATGVDATEAMNRLTEGIAKGSTRALKELGIDLENTENLTEAQAEALQKLTDKFGNIKIEIEDVGELFFALGNNMGTATNQATLTISTWLGSVPVLSSLNDVLTTSTSLWEETGGAIMDFNNMATEAGIIIDMITAKLSGNIAKQHEAANAWKSFTQGLKDTAQGARDYTAAAASGNIFGVAQEAAAEGSIFDPSAVVTGATPKAKGGGGGAKKPKPYELSDIEKQMLMSQVMQPQLGVTGGPSSVTGMPELSLVQTQQSEWEKVLEEDRRKRLAENNEYQWQLELDLADKEKQLQQEKHEWLLANSQEYADAQRRIMLATAMEYGEGVSQMFANLGALMETKSRKAFAVGKAAAIASAVINTALAAIKAYQSLASIPYVGPALGAAAAAAAVVAGGVQISKIKNTHFESAGASASASGFSSSAGSGGGSYPRGVSGAGDAGTPVTINLSIGDESFGSVMTKINDRRSQQGLSSFAMAG